MITAITPTGDRSLAFDLCRQWMENQEIRPEQWIIVDDGKVPMHPSVIPVWAEYIRRRPSCTDPRHTLTLNIEAALTHISGDMIFIIEDDEYYAPSYIKSMATLLQSHEAVGIGCSKYYHVSTGKYMQHGNMKHASLAQTSFKVSLLPLFVECVRKGMQERWLDDWFWSYLQEKYPWALYIFNDDKESLYAGMKGLPGRNGIGSGHDVNSYQYQDTRAFDVLKKWVPNDYKVYSRMREGFAP